MSDEDMIRRGDVKKEIGVWLNEKYGLYSHVGQPIKNLRDAIDTLPAVQAAVRPLEWVEIREGQYFEARVIGILYSVRLGSDGVVRWQAGHMGTWHEVNTIEAAKAAAQADYDARIRSALTAQPSPGVAELVALLAEARTDLSAYVDAACPKHQRSFFPVVQEKWERDMELCWQIDAALARGKGGAA